MEGLGTVHCRVSSNLYEVQARSYLLSTVACLRCVSATTQSCEILPKVTLTLITAVHGKEKTFNKRVNVLIPSPLRQIIEAVARPAKAPWYSDGIVLWDRTYQE